LALTVTKEAQAASDLLLKFTPDPIQCAPDVIWQALSCQISRPKIPREKDRSKPLDDLDDRLSRRRQGPAGTTKDRVRRPRIRGTQGLDYGVNSSLVRFRLEIPEGLWELRYLPFSHH